MTSLTTRTYCPRTGSIPQLAISYFQGNLSARLTRAEATAKFGTSNIAKVLELAIEAGFISSSNGYYTAGDDIDQAPDYGSVAQADATIKAAASTPGGAHSPFAHTYRATPSAKGSRPAKPPLPDLATCALDDDVPLTTARPQKVNWADLLDRLQPGQSKALPLHYAGSIKKAASTRHQVAEERFAIKKISDTEVRIWRTT